MSNQGGVVTSTFTIGRPVCDHCRPYPELVRQPAGIWLRRWVHQNACRPQTVSQVSSLTVLELALQTNQKLDQIISTVQNNFEPGR
jgi:hypothetical protein